MGPEGARARRTRSAVAICAVLLAALLCCVVGFRPFKNTPDIRSDGVGYHTWAYAIAQGDFSFCKYKPLLHSVNALSGESADGRRCRNKYPPGVGLMQLAFSWPLLAEHAELSGFSEGENRVVLWGGAVLLFGTAGLMCALLLRRRVPVGDALLAIGAFIFGTGLFHYSTFDASFSHVYSAFGVALALWLVHEKRNLSPRRLFAFVLVAAWLYAVRQTNAALSLAVVYLFVRQASRSASRRLIVAWLVGTGTAALVLLSYGRYVSGESSLSSYGTEGFPTIGGHFFDVLVSYERGLFSYYPIFLVAIALAVMNWRKAVSQVFVVLVLLFALLYGSWHAWHLGAGFGHRGFVELTPFGMLVLADGLMLISRRVRHLAIMIVCICCVATTLAMSAYWRGDLPFNGAVSSQYWQSLSPLSLFESGDREYSKNQIRNVHLTFKAARERSDGQWDATLLISNLNAKTALTGVTGRHPALRLSWRVAMPGASGDGWDPRADLPYIDPDESASITVAVPPPDIATGNAQLQFSIVQEGVFWAHDVGVAPLAVPWGKDAIPQNKPE